MSEKKAKAARAAASDATATAESDEELAASAGIDVEMLECLTDEERPRFMQLMRERRMVRRGKMRRPQTFRQFIDHVTGGSFKWYRYAIVLCNVLQQVVDGKRKRVIINAPPRHGKSEPASRLLPAYYLYRHPQRWVALTSYGAELAQGLSRAARSNYTIGVGLISREAAAMRQWETGKGGGLWAAGFGGPGLGKGFDLGIIDDPYKNAEEASSLTIRERFRDWYNSVFYTRQAPGAAIVIIMQRWDEEDLCGWLLEQEYSLAADSLIKESSEALRAQREAERDEQLGDFVLDDLTKSSTSGSRFSENDDDDLAEHWHIVNFEAIKRSDDEIAIEEAERGKPRFPPSCTVEPDWRKPGEALAPERYDARWLRRMHARIGDYFFGALYQQNPRARSGGMFSLDSLRIVDDYDRIGATYIRYWDFASTESKVADFTVGALLCRTRAGAYVIIDVVRGQWEQGKRDAMIIAAAEDDRARFGASCTTYGEMEGGSAGKNQAAAFRLMLEGIAYRVFTEHPTGSKEARAQGLATTAAASTQIELIEERKARAVGLSTSAAGSGKAGGNLFALRAEWNAVVRKELIDFPKGTHDDIVDALSGAYNKLARRYRSSPLAPSVSQQG